MTSTQDQVRLERLVGDLRRLLDEAPGDPRVAERAGSPSSRQDAASTVIEASAQRPAGVVSLRVRRWRGQRAHEIAWYIEPEFHGRGVAERAIARLLEALPDGEVASLHAFPASENEAMNSLCARLGFELLGACEFEFPDGRHVRCNDWRLTPGPDSPALD